MGERPAAKQAAENFVATVVLKGHEFIRAVSAAKYARALAPEGCLFSNLLTPQENYALTCKAPLVSNTIRLTGGFP